MEYRNHLRKGLDLLRDIYTGPFRRISQGLGLEEHLRGLNECLEVAVTKTQTVTIEGISAEFHVTTRPELWRLRALNNEREVLTRLFADVRPDDVFFDVGANIGTHSCLVGQQLVDGSVVAFEPHPNNAQRLKENLSLNDVRATVFEYAISNKNGQQPLRVDEGGIGQGKHMLSETSGGNTIEVATIRLDDLVKSGDIPQPDVIKIDVEGAELDALRGMTGTLRQSSCRSIICEIHSSQNEDSEHIREVTELLESHSYDTDVIAERGTEKFVHAQRKGDT
ncbi:FkbM family methyltransferase [Halosimplex aquaticum]|uniref:FkbM family methyltransferase n=1 Tax=Halosimplex aquaticum TaxID=3026162 RepID=A0ABD5Y4E0_9EURY|nr:FkbM family methyltransferase [Halosimplex aquaticum]